MKLIMESFKRFIEDEVDKDDGEKEELEEVGLCHSKKTGHFTDCEAGAVYSLSKKGADRAGVDKKHMGRGNVTSKTKDGDIKYRSLYGANTSKERSCGRIRFPDGDDGYKRYSCGNYNKKYTEDRKQKTHPLVPHGDDSESDRLDKLGYTHHLRALGRGIVRSEELNDDDNGLYISLDDLIQVLQSIPDQREDQLLENSDALLKKCRQIGFTTPQEYFKNLVSTINLLKQSFDGKVGEQK
mgnify:FL=1